MTEVHPYTEVASRIAGLCAGETDTIAKMATIACELFQQFDRFDWVGFYRVTDPQALKIGPYQGTHGCLTIPFSKGVCGACATSGKPQIVADVNAVDDHIACAPTTRSEIVLLVFQSGTLIAVLDIDSDQLEAFDQGDIDKLTAILRNSF